MAQIVWSTTSSGSINLSTETPAEIRWATRSNFRVTIAPVEGTMRVVVVDTAGNALGQLDRAVVTSVTERLNGWETASFTMLVTDPKAHLVLEEKLREVQIWRGDQLLVWGPMVRPSITGDELTVTVNGALWHIARRFIGKANRDNMLRNPGFEQGLAHWTFLRTAFFLDYERLHTNDVRIYRPGLDGNNALEFNADMSYVETYPDAVGVGVVDYYTVVPGDTLWGIAKHYYGSGTEWWRIYEENADRIRTDAMMRGLWNPADPGHWIFPGQPLTIPGVPASEAKELPPEYVHQWGDVFGYQEFQVSGGERGATLTLAGWIKVPSDQFEDWPSGNFGLTLHRLRPDWRTNNYFANNYGMVNSYGGARAIYTDVIETQSSALSEGHPFDGWIRHEVSIKVPPRTTEAVLARINGVNGRTYYDRLTLTRDTAFERHNVDQARICRDLIAEAQNPLYGKNNVNITAETPTTGVRRTLVALHEEHANIWDLITEFTKYRNGIDIGMRYTPTKRIFTTHFPERGRLWDELLLAPYRNLSAFQWTFDGEAAASSVIVLGGGGGSDREEAAAVDLSTFADGLVLETIHAVGPDTPVSLLQELAEEELATVRNPQILSVTTLPHDQSRPERNFIGRLHVGDYLPVRIRLVAHLDDGSEAVQFEIANDYRVVEMTINANDTLNLTLNRKDLSQTLGDASARWPDATATP